MRSSDRNVAAFLIIHGIFLKRINLESLGVKPSTAASPQTCPQRKLQIASKQAPVTDRQSPLLWNFFHAHINDFANGIISRKNRLGFSEFSDHSVVAFNCIRCINYLSDSLRVLKGSSQL